MRLQRLLTFLLTFAHLPLLAQPVGSGQASLRFFGNGINDIDRVKIPLLNPLPNGASLPLNVGNNFTIEFWMRANASQNNGIVYNTFDGDGWITGNVIVDRDIINSPDNGDYGIAMGRPAPSSPIRVVAFGCATSSLGRTIIGSTNVADGNWHHVAVTKSGGTIRIFVDGNLDASGAGAPSGSVSYNNARALSGRTPNPPAFPTNTWDNEPYIVLAAEKHDYDQYVNNSPPQYLSYNGFLDELRISNIVRYSASFTPPSAPFALDANTVALYHFDEGTGTTLTDAAGSSNGVINVGGTPSGPVWSSESPFGANAAAATVTRSVNNSTTSANFNDVGQITGVTIDFAGASGSGTVRVQRFANAPLNPTGVAGNVSQYRWIITSLGSFSFTSATLRFAIADIPNNGVVNPSTVTIYRRPTPDNGSFASLSMLPPLGGELRATTSAFSEFAFGSGDNPLPVELSGFVGESVAEGVRLSWSTISERNNAGFLLLRREATSSDDFQTVASYQTNNALRGRGTTNQPSSYAFLDAGVESGKRYAYRLRSQDYDGSIYDYSNEVVVEVRNAPTKRYDYRLFQNYPNPFNPTTTIVFTMRDAGKATLVVCDLLGKEVFRTVIDAKAGENRYRFDATGLSSGAYFYSLRAGAFSQTRKMLLMK
ncbi:MAG: T9SS type A sorting domain-containing protein [Roseiflexus sp.]|nr:T9SS type A sorting domain-containing protein [Roseiflexus sp.]